MHEPVLDGILIAAGLSSRMGDFKPLMFCGCEPFVTGIARKMARVCRRVVVVTGFRSQDVFRAFHSWRCEAPVILVENPLFEQGMLTSLQAGLRAATDAEWTLYHFVDQPHIPAGFYPEFSRLLSENFDLVQPLHSGRRGHPLLLGKTLMETVTASPPHESLKRILRDAKWRRLDWPCPFPQVLEDFDTPSDCPPDIETSPL